ncbi:MAG: hypothetical protein ACM3PY_05685 [Omnitrophica WOR_2 bacterium]
MVNSVLKYTPSNGYLHNWLVAGPQIIPVSSLDLSHPENRAEVMMRTFDPESGVAGSPVDLGPLGPLTQQNPALTWRYYRCREDHYIDFSAFFPARCYLRSWAYAQLIMPSMQDVTVVLTIDGAADIWLNGEHLNRSDASAENQPRSFSIPAALQSGPNEILLRFENLGLRATPYRMGLQVLGLPDRDVEIAIPTEIEADMLEKRQVLEKVVEKAYLDRYVYGFMDGDRYDNNEHILMRFSNGLDVSGVVTYRLQSLQGDIFREGAKMGSADAVIETVKDFPLRNGPHHFAMLPTPEEYYIKKLRFERKDLFFYIRTPNSQKPYGSWRQRAKEALKDAAQRRSESLFCEIAKMALGDWEKVDHKIISRSMESINQRLDESVFDLLGILGILYRFGKKKHALDELKPLVEACVTGYRYGAGEPGDDSMDFTSESRQILFYTCEILAGQLFPEQVFTCAGKTGAWHKERGEGLAADWLRQRGRYGFREWDSPAGVEAALAACSHLVSLSDSTTIAELASVLMDKVFFTLATHSFKGAYGSSRGRSDTAGVLSARLEATSGISRLMWGMGNFNENVTGVVSLACCREYKLPDSIRKIAADQASAFWSRERSQEPPAVQTGVDSIPWQVNTVTYRTQDFQLSSAQDYDPGGKGCQEHIWQATLGPDAVVFVNHPTSMSEEDASQPNLWAGNGVLPRVAQWGDVLIAVYRLPEDDWLGFTHAYFPAAAFDEYKVQANWAFARKGSGYLALAAAQGLELATGGQTAYRELRSKGGENTWICHMGQALLDGGFAEFQDKIQAMQVNFDGLSVSLQTLRGEQISFGWQAPFVVNGQEQPLSGFPHIENPYCAAGLPADQIDIVYKKTGIRLKFD